MNLLLFSTRSHKQTFITLVAVCWGRFLPICRSPSDCWGPRKCLQELLLVRIPRFIRTITDHGEDARKKWGRGSRRTGQLAWPGSEQLDRIERMSMYVT